MGIEPNNFYETRREQEYNQVCRGMELTNVQWPHMRQWMTTTKEQAWTTWAEKAHYSCGTLGKWMYAEHRERIHQLWREHDHKPRRMVCMANKRKDEGTDYHISLEEPLKETKRPWSIPPVPDDKVVQVRSI